MRKSTVLQRTRKVERLVNLKYTEALKSLLEGRQIMQKWLDELYVEQAKSGPQGKDGKPE